MSYVSLKKALPLIFGVVMSSQAMADDYYDTAPVLSVMPQLNV